MRMTIELTEEQVQRLTDVCRCEGVSRGEVIRRAVADYLDKTHARNPGDTFGIWRDRNVDGMRCERRLRGEWR